MTKKDYKLIAAALKGAHVSLRVHFPVAAFLGWRVAADRVADALAQDNPRFDRARFLKAAGVAS
jgi:hypothetical protein